MAEIGLEHKPITVSEGCKKHFFAETGKAMTNGRLLVECINCWAGDHYNPDTHYLNEGEIKEING